MIVISVVEGVMISHQGILSVFKEVVTSCDSHFCCGRSHDQYHQGILSVCKEVVSLITEEQELCSTDQEVNLTKMSKAECNHSSQNNCFTS